MKHWTIAAFFTGIFLVPLFMRRLKHHAAIENLSSDQRYTIDDFISDQGSLS